MDQMLEKIEVFMNNKLLLYKEDKMYNVDLNLYKTFYIVAKCNNFTKASEELCISQPAVTQAVKKLEAQLNVELFQRSNKGINLTEVGELVYYYAEHLVNIAKSNENLISQIKTSREKVINIGVPTHVGTFYFVNYFKKFNERYPNVKIRIFNKKSDEMLKMLLKRELDIVIDTDMSNVDSEIIKVHKVMDLDGCFVGSRKYKVLSEKGVITPDELIKYPLILPSSTTYNRKMIDYFFGKKNILLEPLIEANSSLISKEIINQGIGIGWMIKEFVLDDLKSGNLYEIKVDIDNIVTPLSIAYHKNYNSSIVLELIKYFNKKTDSEC